MDLTFLVGTDPVPPKRSKTRKASLACMAPAIDPDADGEDDILWQDAGMIDHVLQDRNMEGPVATSVQALTDKGRKANALPLPVTAGTRVAFITNLGSVLTYDDIPEDGVRGTVVTVRSASGDVTAFNDQVHVLWDDGKFRPILAEHLRAVASVAKKAQAVRLRVSTLGDLSAFFEPAMDKTGAETDLIHKATKDLWAFRRDGSEYVVERLFKEDGAPLKV